MVKINRLGIPKEFQQAPVPKGTKDNDNFNLLSSYRRNIDNDDT